jgi:glycosyltransferase involved in cell wall biosynthesis
MAKIKVGMIADAGAPTGFATVTHNVALALQETGDYDIEILGINFDGKPNKWSKVLNIWPARLGGDFLGIGHTDEFYKEVKPDVTFLFQDFWNINHYIAQLPEQAPGIVTYYPVDSPNIKGQYMLPIGATAASACYTEFGVKESIRGAKEAWTKVKQEARDMNMDLLNFITVHVYNGPTPGQRDGFGGDVIIPVKRLKQLTEPSGYEIIPHGVDVHTFYPIDKKDARKALKLGTDWFIVGNVNRNQSRKRLDLTVRGFAEFAKDKPNARLVLHCVRSDPRGWDLGQLALYYGIEDKLILTHALFDGARATEDELNQIYNSFDVQINTCGGEGWGLTNFEGAACGIPQIVPKWSATEEIWEGSGILLESVSVKHELSAINTMHAVIDTKQLSDELNLLYEDEQWAARIGEQCFAVTQRPEYKWENVAKKFDALFKKNAGRSPLSGEVALTREGVIKLKNAKKMSFE